MRNEKEGARGIKITEEKYLRLERRKILNRILGLRAGHCARRVVKGRMSSRMYATILRRNPPQVSSIQ